MENTQKSIAVVMLHGGCNMQCDFCITDGRVQSMSREDYRHLLLRLRRDGFGNIVIGGGEPFTWPGGVAYAAEAAKEEGFYVQVGTNGILMPEKDDYEGKVDRYVLPLDAADASGHDRFRSLSSDIGSHHDLILKRLKQVREWKRSVTVSTVVSRLNLDTLIATGDFLADYVADGGCLHAWHLYCFVPRGRGGSRVADRLGLSRDDFNSAARAVLSQHYPYIIYKRPDMRHSRTVDFFWREQGRLHVGSEVWQETPAGISVLKGD